MNIQNIQFVCRQPLKNSSRSGIALLRSHGRGQEAKGELHQMHQESELSDPSITLKYLKLLRMLWATFLSTCFNSTVTTTEWIQLNPTNTYKRCTIKMHSNIALACSGLLHDLLSKPPELPGVKSSGRWTSTFFHLTMLLKWQQIARICHKAPGGPFSALLTHAHTDALLRCETFNCKQRLQFWM